MRRAAWAVLGPLFLTLSGCQLWHDFWHGGDDGQIVEEPVAYEPLEALEEEASFEEYKDDPEVERPQVVESQPKPTDEQAAYIDALIAGTPEAYERFLEAYPNSSFADVIRAQLEGTIAEEAGSYASSSSVTDEIKFVGGDDVGHLLNCVSCPSPEEREAFNRAAKLNTADSYQAYIADYPVSHYSQIARARLADLESGASWDGQAAGQRYSYPAQAIGRDGAPVGLNAPVSDEDGVRVGSETKDADASDTALSGIVITGTVNAANLSIGSTGTGSGGGGTGGLASGIGDLGSIGGSGSGPSPTGGYGASTSRKDTIEGTTNERPPIYETARNATIVLKDSPRAVVTDLPVYETVGDAVCYFGECSETVPVSILPDGAEVIEGEASGAVRLANASGLLGNLPRGVLDNVGQAIISDTCIGEQCSAAEPSSGVELSADSIISRFQSQKTRALQIVTSGFDAGRIVHHAPKEMVLERPYFLEIAIQPVTGTVSVEQVDRSLFDSVGTGIAPGIDAPAIASVADSLPVSELMSAALVGSGFDITATTEVMQPIFPNEPTKWQWEVIPRQAGTPTLTFTVSQALTIAGREVNRTVKTIPLSIEVQSLDDLLAEEPVFAERSAPATVTTRKIPGIGTNSLLPGLVNSSASKKPAVDQCQTLEGTDPNRHALLLTNLEYAPPISRLDETHRDGERMAEALNYVGFTVTHCRDLGKPRTYQELRKLGRNIKARVDLNEKPVSFFYYSGHGVYVNGSNYILPIDLLEATPEAMQDGGLRFEEISNRIPSDALTFVVFDACRTVMQEGTKGFFRTYEPVSFTPGLFQAFAAEPGKVAVDEGLYSSMLANLMVSLTEPAHELFKQVQIRVGQETNNRQTPSYLDQTGAEFFFKAG